jgi:hypothetical protein
MKYILAIMCGLVALFMGGCAVLLLPGGFSSGGAFLGMPMLAIPAGIAFLNVAIIGALFGWKVRWKPAFYILGVIDILIAVGALLTASSMGPNDQPVFWFVAAVFAAKGVLSFIYARNLEAPAP